MTSLDDRLSTMPQTWKPEEGDRLIGLVLDVEERDSDYSEDTYPAATVEVEEGPEGEQSQNEGKPVPVGTTLVFYASQASGKWQLRKKKVVEGDRIAAKYLGLGEQSKAGMAKPKQFNVVVLERGSKNGSSTAADPDEPASQTDTDQTDTDQTTGQTDTVPF